MSRFALRVLGRTFVLSLLLGVLPAASGAPASQPTLFSIGTATPKVLAQGVQKSWPIKLDEDSAMDAVFRGGMWLPNPSGGRIYVKYSRHILHANGTWTFIGTVGTTHGEQSVVLTFGKDSVFGLVPQASGYPLRIVTTHGQMRIVETSAHGMVNSPEALRLHGAPDYRIPPRVLGRSAMKPAQAATAAQAVPGSGTGAAARTAAPAGSVTIDVMVAYTPGFVSELGSVYTALTRIQNLVDITNQAYIDSGVNQQIRLVFTTEVNYPDDTSNSSALDDITGSNGTSAIPIPPSLQNIAPQRVQYGADLVVLIRSFNNATQNGCGDGWLIGGGEVPINPSQDNVWGYSVVSDGSDAAYYCLDTTFAHELGHNMGDAHDRSHADGPGAYPYSYGYVGGGTNGFSTIMAYGTATQTPLAVFSNPNISTCQNQPCGVPDSSSSSADNAHSMNNTAALIAAFEPAVVGNIGIGFSASNDMNGDGDSDLLFLNPSTNQFAYWLMKGAQSAGGWVMPVSPGYRIAATGDFAGNGFTDLVWTSSANDVWMWLNDGTSFTGKYVGAYAAGYSLIGAANITGGSGEELLFVNKQTHTFAYWVIRGAQIVSERVMQISPGYYLGAIGDFNGDGKADLIWTSVANDLWMWTSTGSGFTGQYIGSYPAGWQLGGACDVNGDGYSDLIWSNPESGQFSYWLMEGAQAIGSWSGSASPEYRIAATGDFNNDGMCDIMWTSAANDLWLWTSTGSGFDGKYVGVYSSGWTVLPSQIMAAWDEP